MTVFHVANVSEAQVPFDGKANHETVQTRFRENNLVLVTKELDGSGRILHVHCVPVDVIVGWIAVDPFLPRFLSMTVAETPEILSV